MAKSFYEQKCRICGCDWNHACNDHDYWFAEDLCSACAEAMKPIPFNTPMVQAVLENRKKSTRRVIKFDFSHVYKAACAAGKWSESFGNTIPDSVAEWYAKKIAKQSYQPGDVLYVRETWGICGFDDDEMTMSVTYKADDSQADIKLPEEKYQKYYEEMSEAEPDWHPSIHMPKQAARLFLRVKDVRVERLHDITEDGAIAEGLISTAKMTPDGLDYTGLMAYDQFHPLWDSTVKRVNLPLYGWDANPWVWAYEFERVGDRKG